jgi:hypothetical protein
MYNPQERLGRIPSHNVNYEQEGDVGRPKKILTPEQIAQLEKLAALLPMEQIADVLDINDRTLRRRMQDDPDVLSAYKKGVARAHASVAGNILKLAQNGNLTAAIFYAKTQMGWNETRNVNANVTTGEFILDLTGNDEDKA